MKSQPAAAIFDLGNLLPATCCIPASQQGIQTTTRNIPSSSASSLLVAGVAVVWCLVTAYTTSNNSVYNRQNAPSILQM